MTEPTTRDWNQEQLEMQEHREAVDKLGRFIEEKSGMAAAHQTVGAMWLAMQILEDGPRSGVIPAARAVRLLEENCSPKFIVRPPALPLGQLVGEQRPTMPTREEVERAWQQASEFDPDRPQKEWPLSPLERFALLILEGWGQ